MSIALGLKYAGGIVLATDSRVSGGHVDESICKFDDKPIDTGVIVFVGAGAQTDIDAAMAYINDCCANANITSLRMFRQFAEDLINYVANRSSRSDPDIELLLGVRYQQNVKDAALSQTDLLKATFDQEDKVVHVETVRKHAAIGSGGPVASYLLKCLYPKKSKEVIAGREPAEKLSLYVIDEIIHAQVEGCGGPARLRTITAVPFAKVKHANDTKKWQMREQMQPNLGKADKVRRDAIFGYRGR